MPTIAISFETLLVVGSVLAVLSIVSIFTAMIEGRRARFARFAVLVAIGLLVMAVMKADRDLSWRTIPDAFVTVVARIIN